MPSVLNIKQLKKTYDHRPVLSIDEMSIAPGAIYGLIGPNGAGKTTLMRAILGLISYEGDIQLFGKSATSKNQRALNRHIGSLIERPAFYEHLTGRENLDILCRLKGISPTDIDPILEKVGLFDVKDKQARHYSLGMKQRLGIAMALIGEPPLLILDEPINGLDPYGIEEMRRLFTSLVSNGKTSLLISSHILDEIEKIATHIGILEDGILRYHGTLSDYRKRHPAFISLETEDNLKALRLIGISEAHIQGKKIILGPTPNAQIAHIVNILTPEVPIYRIEEEKQSLETLFIKDLTPETGGVADERSRI